MNRYEEMKNRQQKAVNEYLSKYAFFAFSEKQFIEGARDLATRCGLDPVPEKWLASIGAGGYMVKTATAGFKTLMTEIDKEMQAAIAADPDGNGFIYDMFEYELFNHEYGITCDFSDTLDACGLSWEDLQNNPALLAGLKKAAAYVMENTN